MKQVREYYNCFDTCREHDIPLCADACPFHMDMLEFQERITKKRINAAYKTLRECVTFPAIVSELCPAYCQDRCIRKTSDEALQISLLEKSIINLAARKDPNAYNLPTRPVKVAVIGAGLSGMAFALKMAVRKCQVTIFEREPEIGGQLKGLMAKEDYMAEFDLQFKNEKYDLLTGCEAAVDTSTGIVTAGGVSYNDFNVVYIATGKDGDSFGVPLPKRAEGGSVAGGCMKAGETGIFVGGCLCGRDLMEALADGNNMSAVADDFAKTGNLSYPQETIPSRCEANSHKLKYEAAVAPGALTVGEPVGATDTSGMAASEPDTIDTPGSETDISVPELYTEAECVAEASRCIRCQCDACASYCDLIGYYKKWPVKMRDEVFLSVKPAGSLVHKCPSRKAIAACTDCGIMEETCPENIKLCSMIKSARYQMHKVEKMPAAYKQYYLRDMEFANGEYASIVRKAPENYRLTEAGSDEQLQRGEHNRSELAGDVGRVAAPAEGYAFFPGCNLGALHPDYVIKPYKWLLENYPGTSLMLKCCGIPIDWAGNEKAHSDAINELRNQWESLGKPVIVTACMSCYKHFKEHLPEIPVTTIYELMVKSLDQLPEPAKLQQQFSIFDPCSARNNDSVQEAIRTLTSRAGLEIAELPEGDRHGCCGFGGQGAMAQPDFADYVAMERVGLSDNPYIVYCSNCRDIFTGQGKKALHMLDLLFSIDPVGDMPAPGVTDRRVNRVALKERLLKEIWGEDMTEKPETIQYELRMSDDIRNKANKLRILDSDISNVIERADRTERRTRNPENGHYKAYNEIGAITLWVEYSCPEECVREVHNLYTHRMQIKLEAVFNGRKIDG